MPIETHTNTFSGGIFPVDVYFPLETMWMNALKIKSKIQATATNVTLS